MQILYVTFAYSSAFLHKFGATCAYAVHKMHPYLGQTVFHQAPLLNLERRLKRQRVLPLDLEAQ